MCVLKDISWFVVGMFATVDVKYVLLMVNAPNLLMPANLWAEPVNCILQVCEQNKEECNIKSNVTLKNLSCMLGVF